MWETNCVCMCVHVCAVCMYLCLCLYYKSSHRSSGEQDGHWGRGVWLADTAILKILHFSPRATKSWTGHFKRNFRYFFSFILYFLNRLPWTHSKYIFFPYKQKAGAMNQDVELWTWEGFVSVFEDFILMEQTGDIIFLNKIVPLFWEVISTGCVSKT